MTHAHGQFVRMMSSSDPAKAYRQLADLARDGGIRRGMVIAELDDGHIHVVGQRANPEDLGHLLLAAAEGLKRVTNKNDRPTVEPEVRHRIAEAKQSGPIALEWASLTATVHAGTTSPEQIIESRRMFYAGAAALMKILTTTMDPGDIETEADLKLLDVIGAELETFGDQLQAGKA